jgi:hypothetical protein
MSINLGEINLISNLDYHPGSPKNIGRVGGFYFIIFISPRKTIDDNFNIINKRGMCCVMLLTCALG